MAELLWSPKRWPATMPDVLQLYSQNTPNGQKVGICLEEMGLSYEPHLINIKQGDQHDPDYLRLSPNGKIPAILDPNGPEDQPIILMESIVILQYLADKTGMFFPQTYRARLEAMQWLAFQNGHTGPMFGQFGHFYKFGRHKTTDSYARERYTKETRRLLGVLDERLKDREYLMGDYTIVDMAHCPWVDGLDKTYGAADDLGLAEFEHVDAWRKRCTSRLGYIKGKDVCKPD